MVLGSEEEDFITHSKSNSMITGIFVLVLPDSRSHKGNTEGLDTPAFALICVTKKGTLSLGNPLHLPQAVSKSAKCAVGPGGEYHPIPQGFSPQS